MSKRKVIYTYLLASMLLVASLLFPLQQQADAAKIDYSYGWTYMPDTLGDESWGGEAVINSDGNLYVVSGFAGTIDFDPTEGIDEYTSSGDLDGVLTKFSADGTYQWTKTWGGTGTVHGRNLAIDQNDNLYIAGYFLNATIDFDPGAGTDEHTTNGSYDTYLTKYNADGSYAWTKTWGGTQWDFNQSIKTDNEGNVYLTGYFQNTVDFDPGAGTDEHTSSGGNDAYLTKFNADGSHAWTKTWGSTGSDAGNELAIDSNNNSYLVGSFQNTVDFDPGAGTDEHTTNGSYDTYLTKYNTDGSYAWTKTWGGTGSDTGYTLNINNGGNVFVTGEFTNTVDFDPGAGTDEHTSNGDSDAFVTKFGNDGSYGWTKTWGGNEYDSAYTDIVFNNNGDFHIPTMYYSSSVDFDPGASEALGLGEGSGDFALSTFSNDGTFKSLLTWSGSDYDDISYMLVDTNDNIYLSGGSYSTSLDFNPFAGEDKRTLSGKGDMFLTKLTATHYQHGTVKSGLKVTHPASGNDVTKHAEGVERSASVALRLDTDTGTPLADFTADMSTDRDWSSISGSSDSTNYKSVVSGLAGADGVNGTHSLYVPKKDTDTAVHICPDAQTLEQVTTDCSNGQTYTENDSNVSVVEVNGASYWLVSGLSGTGGMSTTGELVDTGIYAVTYALLAVVLIVCGGVSSKVTAKR